MQLVRTHLVLAHAGHLEELHGCLELALLAVVEVGPGISFQGFELITVLVLKNFPQELDSCLLLFLTDLCG